MVDVGGQRSERRKWIHCFDNVNLVLFIVALSDYDYLDPEESYAVSNIPIENAQKPLQCPTLQNRLLKNHEIFTTIVQSEHFRKASIVLFLNKKDIFEEKLNSVPLTVAFPDYKGMFSKFVLFQSSIQ